MSIRLAVMRQRTVSLAMLVDMVQEGAPRASVLATVLLVDTPLMGLVQARQRPTALHAVPVATALAAVLLASALVTVHLASILLSQLQLGRRRPTALHAMPVAMGQEAAPRVSALVTVR